MTVPEPIITMARVALWLSGDSSWLIAWAGEWGPLEKEMATHSSMPAWRILWTEEPGRLQFMGSQRVGHD